MQHQIISRFSETAREGAVVCAKLGLDPVVALLFIDRRDAGNLSVHPGWSEVYALTGSKSCADDCAFLAREYDQGLITDLAEALGVQS